MRAPTREEETQIAGSITQIQTCRWPANAEQMDSHEYPEDRMRFHLKRKKVICGVHLHVLDPTRRMREHRAEIDQQPLTPMKRRKGSRKTFSPGIRRNQSPQA